MVFCRPEGNKSDYRLKAIEHIFVKRYVLICVWEKYLGYFSLWITKDNG